MRSVREFVTLAFKAGGYEIKFEGSGTEEIGRDAKTGRELVKVDPAYFRPAEVETLLG